MEGSVETRAWLRCYRCWSTDLEVQVHYEGIHRIDPHSGERAEVVDELQEAVVQCLECMHDQPHLGFRDGRVEPVEDRWERMIAGTPWVASCTVAVDADDVETCSGPEAGDALAYAAFGDNGTREFFTHVRFHKHDDDNRITCTCSSSSTRAPPTRPPRSCRRPRAAGWRSRRWPRSPARRRPPATTATSPYDAVAAAAMAAAERSTSASVVDQFENDTRRTSRPPQRVPPSQQVPSRWIAAIAARLAASSPARRTSTWLSTTSLRTSAPGDPGQQAGHAPGVRAAALDELGHPVAPQGPQRGVDGHGARPPRGLGHEVRRLAPGLVGGQVLGAERHARAVGLGVARRSPARSRRAR